MADITRIIEIKIDPDTRGLDEFDRHIDRIDGRLVPFEQRVGRTSRGIGLLGAAMAAAAAGGAYLLGREMTTQVRTFIDYEQQLLSVRKNLNLTKEETKEFGRELQRISGEIGTPTGDLAARASVAGQVGLDADEAQNLAVVASRLSVAAESINNADDAVLILARLREFTGNEGDPLFFERAASSIVELGSETPATEAEILSLIETIQSLTSTTRSSADEVIGFAGGLARLGQAPELTSSTLSRSVNNIRESLRTNDENAGLFAAILGVDSVEEAGQIAERSGIELFTRFVSGLQQAQNQGVNLDELLSSLGDNFADQRSRRVLSAAIGNSQGLLDSRQRAADEFANPDRLQQEAQIQLDTTGSLLDQVGSKVTTLRTRLGEPITETFVDGVLHDLDAYLERLEKATRDTEGFKETWGTVYTTIGNDVLTLMDTLGRTDDLFGHEMAYRLFGEREEMDVETSMLGHMVNAISWGTFGQPLLKSIGPQVEQVGEEAAKILIESHTGALTDEAKGAIDEAFGAQSSSDGFGVLDQAGADSAMAYLRGFKAEIDQGGEIDQAIADAMIAPQESVAESAMQTGEVYAEAFVSGAASITAGAETLFGRVADAAAPYLRIMGALGAGGQGGGPGAPMGATNPDVGSIMAELEARRNPDAGDGTDPNLIAFQITRQRRRSMQARFSFTDQQIGRAAGRQAEFDGMQLGLQGDELREFIEYNEELAVTEQRLQRITSAAGEMGSALADSLQDAIKNGGDLGDILESLGGDLTDIAFDLFVRQSLQSAFSAAGSAGGQGAGIGGILSAFFSSQGFNGGLVTGGGILSFANGGLVPGIDRGVDTVPAMLRPGEVVMNPDAVRSIGRDRLLHGNKTGSMGGGMVNHITVQGPMSPRDAMMTGEQIGRGIAITARQGGARI